jgi:hypothetical protein
MTLYARGLQHELAVATLGLSCRLANVRWRSLRWTFLIKLSAVKRWTVVQTTPLSNYVKTHPQQQAYNTVQPEVPRFKFQRFNSHPPIIFRYWPRLSRSGRTQQTCPDLKLNCGRNPAFKSNHLLHIIDHRRLYTDIDSQISKSIVSLAVISENVMTTQYQPWLALERFTSR